jgi:CubicO group peptidase (beta-lactamase class C family)
MIKKLTFLLCLSLLWLANIACAQSKADQIDALVSKFHDYNQFTGSVLVSHHGKVIYKKGFGLANRETNTSNTPDTRHRLASVSKQFAATVIMQLVAEGKLKLEVPITTYLPAYPKATGDQITLHHLMTHTAGIPNYTSFENYREVMGKSMTPAEIVALFSNEPLEFSPGEKYAYSNSGYVLLGHIIETVTGKSYGEVLQQKIFGPLNMINSGYERADDNAKNKAIGYNQVGNVFEPAQYIHMSIPHAAGALFSSVEDMHLWNEAQYTAKLLPKKYLDLIFAPHIPSYSTAHYAYGWEIGTLPVGNSGTTVNTVYHSGGINGFSTMNVRIPDEKSSIVILSNSSGSSVQDMLRAINGILHDKLYDMPKQSIAYYMLDVITEKGIDKAVDQYTSIVKANTHYLNENEMNVVGYQLLQSGKTKEAATVFKWNVEAFPRSWNVYDSYGEALLALGDTAQSIINYKKSLDINPNSEYGIKALRSLGVDPDSFLRKVPVEDLQLLAGDYVAIRPGGNEWKISFAVDNGVLSGRDGGYRYKLAPQSNTDFINPDDGALLKFDTRDRGAITLALFGLTFRKV